MKYKYKIPVIWQMVGVVEVEAESLQDAIDEAEDNRLPEGSYIDDSFEVDYDGIEHQNHHLPKEALA